MKGLNELLKNSAKSKLDKFEHALLKEYVLLKKCGLLKEHALLKEYELLKQHALLKEPVLLKEHALLKEYELLKKYALLKEHALLKQHAVLKEPVLLKKYELLKIINNFDFDQFSENCDLKDNTLENFAKVIARVAKEDMFANNTELLENFLNHVLCAFRSYKKIHELFDNDFNNDEIHKSKMIDNFCCKLLKILPDKKLQIYLSFNSLLFEVAIQNEDLDLVKILAETYKADLCTEYYSTYGILRNKPVEFMDYFVSKGLEIPKEQEYNECLNKLQQFAR